MLRGYYREKSQNFHFFKNIVLKYIEHDPEICFSEKIFKKQKWNLAVKNWPSFAFICLF